MEIPKHGRHANRHYEGLVSAGSRLAYGKFLLGFFRVSLLKPPCRKTFTIFTKKLLEHQDLIGTCPREIIAKLRTAIRGFGNPGR